jgi:hypothetical protein
LNTQKPLPLSAYAWCVPPARLADTPSRSAVRAAAMVAPTEHLERGVRPEDVVDHDDVRAVHHAHAHGGLRALGQPLGVHDRATAQLVEVQIRVAELQQPGAELILVRVAVLFHEPVGLQRLQQSVHGRTREPQPIGQLADAQPPRPAGERLENARGAIYGLDHSSALGCAIRHCRIHFDHVE